MLRFVDGTVDPVGATDISGNAAGCNATTEITNACLSELTINSDTDIPSDAGTLTRIRGNLTIGGTTSTFPNFAALEVVEGNLVISGLTTSAFIAFTDIFLVLEEVQGDLIIQNNEFVRTITGFVALSEVDGNVSIGGVTSGDGNDALTAVPDLNALTTIGGDLVIANNGVLTTAPALSGLTTLTGDLTVQDNAQLASCCGLLRLVDNTVVPGGSTTISGNATGCESGDAIEAACGVSRTLSVSQDAFTASSAAGSVNFDVTADVPWAITNSDAWITDITPNSGMNNQLSITITYEENTQNTQREAILTLAATDGGSESETITLTQAAASTDVVLGLPAVGEGLRFYPNPALNTLYVEGITQETSLIIRTLAGRTLLRTTLRQNQAIDLTTLPQGVYLLTLQSGQERLTRRLVRGF